MYLDHILNLSEEEAAELLRDFDSDPKMADTQYKIIMEEISAFEDSLDDDHEVALKLCNFGQNILLNVTDIGCHNPSLIFFYGTVNGKEAQLIQHVSQISFLLTSVEKHDPTCPPRRIGFQANEDDQD